MRREKFVYNTQTLRYEKVVVSNKSRLLRAFGFFCAAILTAFIFTLVTHRYTTSPKEKAYLREIDKLKIELQEKDHELDRMSDALTNLYDRDAYAHRLIFGMDPIDDGVWNGGIGGHDQGKEYKQFSNSGELMASIDQKVGKLKRQMVLQSKSLDTIINMAKEKEEMFAAIPSIKPVRKDKLVRNIRLLSGFGMRIHPILKVPKMHKGIDFTAPTGTPIHSTGAGKVIRSEYSRTFGNVVEIDHGYGYRTIYAHMHTTGVKKGEEVARGQKIGTVGSTGRSTAPHCHYEVIYKGRHVNPINFCMDGLSPEEYKILTEAAQQPNQALDYE
ncbi:MAG: M23 family metallopeptidase [Bacteroidota bacterium]